MDSNKLQSITALRTIKRGLTGAEYESLMKQIEQGIATVTIVDQSVRIYRDYDVKPKPQFEMQLDD